MCGLEDKGLVGLQLRAAYCTPDCVRQTASVNAEHACSSQGYSPAGSLAVFCGS